MFFRGMRPIKQFRNRKGFQASGHVGIRIAARAQIQKEHFMLPRAMRKYWDEQHTPIYGPCSCVSKWLKWKKMKPTSEFVRWRKKCKPSK